MRRVRLCRHQTRYWRISGHTGHWMSSGVRRVRRNGDTEACHHSKYAFNRMRTLLWGTLTATKTLTAVTRGSCPGHYPRTRAGSRPSWPRPRRGLWSWPPWPSPRWRRMTSPRTQGLTRRWPSRCPVPPRAPPRPRCPRWPCRWRRPRPTARPTPRPSCRPSPRFTAADPVPTCPLQVTQVLIKAFMNKKNIDKNTHSRSCWAWNIQPVEKSSRQTPEKRAKRIRVRFQL